MNRSGWFVQALQMNSYGVRPLRVLRRLAEVVGLDEVSEVVAELVVGVVVEPPDGGVLDGAVHAFDLAIGPRMLWLGQPVIDVGEGTGVFESLSSEGLLARDHLADLDWGPGFAL